MRVLITILITAVSLYSMNKTVTVVSNGWHAGLVFNTADIDLADWPQSADFRHFEYIEAGWGDEAFYRSREPGWWLHIRGALWPTPSVLHIQGFHTMSKQFLKQVTLHFSPEAYKKIVRFVSGYYMMEKGRPIGLGRGLTHNSRFYRAKYPYHIFRTCNAWVAEALNQGGMDLRPATILTTEQLFEQLETATRSKDGHKE